MQAPNSATNNSLTFREASQLGLDHLKKSSSIEAKDIKEKVQLLLVRDLLRLNWKVVTDQKDLKLRPPETYDKNIIKESMNFKRQDILHKNKAWIDKYIILARENLAQGRNVLVSKILPRIEVCKKERQHNLFRIFRYYWSSPYSEYVGRRIRLIIRDDGIEGSPVIGIAALGSSVIHIPDRDKWIGWDTKTRTKNIVYTMDAYICGALPPYNFLLGGKLISYILASNEVREIFREKYKSRLTTIKRRKAYDLACIFTTGLYGNSSQYNRLKYKKRLIYHPIGSTSGYGTLHISDETFRSMHDLLMHEGIVITNRFGGGPNWRMRVIRTAAEIIGLDSDILLNHSFRRDLYAVPLARNFRSFLLGRTDKLSYHNLPMQTLARFWKNRWLNMRKKNIGVINKVRKFKPECFDIC